MTDESLIDRPPPGWTRVSLKCCAPSLIAGLKEYGIFRMFDRVPVSIEDQPILRMEGDNACVTFFSSGWQVKLGQGSAPSSLLEYEYVSDQLVPNGVLVAPGVVWKQPAWKQPAFATGSPADIVCRMAGSCPRAISGRHMTIGDHYAYGDEPIVGGLKFSKLAGWEWTHRAGSLAPVEFFSNPGEDELRSIIDEVIANLDLAQAELASR